jgi:hypothetical protein
MMDSAVAEPADDRTGEETLKGGQHSWPHGLQRFKKMEMSNAKIEIPMAIPRTESLGTAKSALKLVLA